MGLVGLHTHVLFAGELFCTALKALALLSKNKKVLMSVAGEGTNIWGKVCERGKVLSERQRWRAVFELLAYCSSITCCAVSFGWDGRIHTKERIAVLLMTVLLAFPSLLLRQKYHRRMA